MQRDRWEFEFTSAALCEAAKKKVEFHNGRVTWWCNSKDKVMQEIKDAGIEVSESVGAQYGNTTTGYGPQVMVRNDLQKKLTECHNKIDQHRTKSAEYDGWVQVLSVDKGTRRLHADDYLYFFGK